MATIVKVSELFGVSNAFRDTAEDLRRLGELGIRFSPDPDRWVGPRPTLPDYLPAIGRLERDPRILYAFGHQHLGLTMAAVTAELTTALAEGAEPAIDLTPFRIERFGPSGR